VPRPCPEKHPIYIQPDFDPNRQAINSAWLCEAKAVAGHDVAWAEVLSKKYGVPCISTPVTEFFMKLDEGSL
jgi:hypothetical protein